VLEPLVRDVGLLQRRVAELEAEIAHVREDAEFYEGSANELVEQIFALGRHLRAERTQLAQAPAVAVVDAILRWLNPDDRGHVDVSRGILACVALDDTSVLAAEMEDLEAIADLNERPFTAPHAPTTGEGETLDD
jgi:hypothetical protein